MGQGKGGTGYRWEGDRVERDRVEGKGDGRTGGQGRGGTG